MAVASQLPTTASMLSLLAEICSRFCANSNALVGILYYSTRSKANVRDEGRLASKGRPERVLTWTKKHPLQTFGAALGHGGFSLATIRSTFAQGICFTSG
jgi:hypothetical protein